MWPFDQNNQQMYQQYAQAYDTGNFTGLDHHHALGWLQQFITGAPPDMQQQIYQQHFAQMPYDQRAFLAQQVPPQSRTATRTRGRTPGGTRGTSPSSAQRRLLLTIGASGLGPSLSGRKLLPTIGNPQKKVLLAKSML